MIVENTNYYARPGLAADVLAHRHQGCRVREAMGLSPGRVFVKVEGDGPDVRWECVFDSRAAFEADLEARKLSPAFAEQRRAMGTLTLRFERHVQELSEL